MRSSPRTWRTTSHHPRLAAWQSDAGITYHLDSVKTLLVRGGGSYYDQATGRLWFKREYQQNADTRSYKDQSGQPRDPFQNLYSTLANDLLAYRQQLPVADLEKLTKVYRGVLDRYFAS